MDVQAVYEAAVERFRHGPFDDLDAGFNPCFDPPTLAVKRVDNYEINRADETIYMHPAIPDTVDQDDLATHFIELFKMLYEDALTERAQDAAAWLEEMYGARPQLDRAYFINLPDGSLAKSKRWNGEFRMDLKYLPDFDWRTARFATDDPRWSTDAQLDRVNQLLDNGPDALDTHVSHPAATPLHELRHWLEYDIAPETLQYKQNRDDITQRTGDNRPWRNDITVAPLEAGTTFDQFLYGYTGKKKRKTVLRAAHAPREHPEFFEGYQDLTGSPDEYTIRNPYNLGLFLGIAAYDRFQTEYSDDATALRAARQYTLTLADPIEDLQQELDAYLEWRLGQDRQAIPPTSETTARHAYD